MMLAYPWHASIKPLSAHRTTKGRREKEPREQARSLCTSSSEVNEQVQVLSWFRVLHFKLLKCSTLSPKPETNCSSTTHIFLGVFFRRSAIHSPKQVVKSVPVTEAAAGLESPPASGLPAGTPPVCPRGHPILQCSTRCAPTCGGLPSQNSNTVF